jgi:FtsH-binding integral membrane protein
MHIVCLPLKTQDVQIMTIYRVITMKTLNRDEGLSYPTEGGIDLHSIMCQVYIWMGLGMLLTAGVAYLAVSTALINLVSPPIILGGWWLGS